MEDLNKMYAQTEIQMQTCAQMRRGGGGVHSGRYSSREFRFYVPSVSSSYNTRSVIILTRTSGNGGKAEVRLDEEKNKTIYINTKSIYGQTRLDTVATRVKPGYHTITVRTVRKVNFPSEWSCSRAARLWKTKSYINSLWPRRASICFIRFSK